MSHGYEALSDKEKETLRLILNRHDAKSMARELALSVHTINERLRSARRKLQVTSSKEAARLLLQQERPVPAKTLGYKHLGDEPVHASAADDGSARARNGRGLMIGAILMLTTLAILTLTTTLPANLPVTQDAAPHAVAADDAEKESAAREWLALTDASDWQGSYDATGSAFQELNTAEVWEAVSLEARAPLGAVIRRDAISFQHLAAPPMGYWQVRFSTDFAERQDVIESVTLEREDGALRVVGYIIE
ncbi:DUF4019 domain-containing protein [Aurantiacibacter rhizosphaerae]|uniref:DUF4019 domain-containing protein n=1 Tax=Aurantiacibacter rhizosphaerae TaxID=2691582 RepID=A0A844X851_9SPHN|nr:DUF4019 domain-containing protein [Aurantiacibacter rhizosphaerae]MWV26517.1 DUF4019 domain-containing protein [Aurantiacibacter rhizosphaerae]